jgi:hypothetical protein
MAVMPFPLREGMDIRGCEEVGRGWCRWQGQPGMARGSKQQGRAGFAEEEKILKHSKCGRLASERSGKGGGGRRRKTTNG